MIRQHRDYLSTGLICMLLIILAGLSACATPLPTPTPTPTPTPAPAPILIDDAPNLCLNPVEGNVGTEIMVIGTGFIPGKEVTIFYAMKTDRLGRPDDPDDRRMATVVVDSRQAFLVSFTALGEGGGHTVTATDGTNTLTARFIMDIYPPPCPGLRLPGKGTRAVPRTHFEWTEVIDPSGITYRLQIASDEVFSRVVLDKGGITASEYTLTREEKLESTKKDAPYYWRVKAVDGASNESGWTAPGAFYVD